MNKQEFRREAERTLRDIFRYIDVDMKYAQYGQLVTYMEWFYKRTKDLNVNDSRTHIPAPNGLDELGEKPDATKRAALQARVKRLAQTMPDIDLEAAEDELIAFQEASGLMCGGDPGGVTPRMVQEHTRFLGEIRQAAEDGRAKLPALLAEYRERYPEV